MEIIDISLAQNRGGRPSGIQLPILFLLIPLHSLSSAHRTLLYSNQNITLKAKAKATKLYDKKADFNECTEVCLHHPSHLRMMIIMHNANMYTYT